MILAIFLTVSVGEGQAYDVNTLELADEELLLGSDGFIGKPQIVGQTVLTGETQTVINYKVEQGDTLLGIASRYSLSVGTLVDYNDLQTSEIEKIKPGDNIIIPTKDTNTSLAWLNDLNQLKAVEAEKARQAELKRLTAQRSRSTSLPRLARSIGGVNILGYFPRIGPYSTVPGNCTTWAKHKLAAFRPYVMGNGGQWAANAPKFGFRTGNVAVPNSAVVTNENGRVGHVAVVEEVYSNGTMLISEMNFVGWAVASTRIMATDDPVIKKFVYTN